MSTEARYDGPGPLVEVEVPSVVIARTSKSRQCNNSSHRFSSACQAMAGPVPILTLASFISHSPQSAAPKPKPKAPPVDWVGAHFGSHWTSALWRALYSTSSWYQTVGNLACRLELELLNVALELGAVWHLAVRDAARVDLDLQRALRDEVRVGHLPHQNIVDRDLDRVRRPRDLVPVELVRDRVHGLVQRGELFVVVVTVLVDAALHVLGPVGVLRSARRVRAVAVDRDGDGARARVFQADEALRGRDLVAGAIRREVLGFDADGAKVDVEEGGQLARRSASLHSRVVIRVLGAVVEGVVLPGGRNRKASAIRDRAFRETAREVHGTLVGVLGRAVDAAHIRRPLLVNR
mmetsp:Transcript_41123/g.109763  ORF Transcript_41123/g.109763 Transcript_41123/m.109763 type:complete len:350 (-) Transcript_41123:272-1321(-)